MMNPGGMYKIRRHLFLVSTSLLDFWWRLFCVSKGFNWFYIITILYLTCRGSAMRITIKSLALKFAMNILVTFFLFRNPNIVIKTKMLPAILKKCLHCFHVINVFPHYSRFWLYGCFSPQTDEPWDFRTKVSWEIISFQTEVPWEIICFTDRGTLCALG